MTPRIQQAWDSYQTELRRLLTTSSVFDDLRSPDIYKQHSAAFLDCADEILRPQNRKFVVDDHNKKILRFLLLYFNGCEDALSVFPEEEYSLSKHIMICGAVGVGKTLIMDAFALYLRRTGNPLQFTPASVSEMMNFYKINNHLDHYMYNVGERSFEGNPISLCVNDIGLKTQKYYGQDTQEVMNEFFHARNEIYVQEGIRTHITTNLPANRMLEVFNDEYGRLNDRWKTYNVLDLSGDSRR